MGRLSNTVRVMVKPLSRATLDCYLSLVARDRPETGDTPLPLSLT